MTKDNKAVSYERVTPPNWDKECQKFRFNSQKKVLSGDCPRCGHEFEFSLADEIGHGLGPVEEIDYFWICLCGSPHEGASDEKGCGARGKTLVDINTGAVRSGEHA